MNLSESQMLMLLRNESFYFLKRVLKVRTTIIIDSNKIAVKNQYGLNPVACKEGAAAKFSCLLEASSRLDSKIFLHRFFLFPSR